MRETPSGEKDSVETGVGIPTIEGFEGEGSGLCGRIEGAGRGYQIMIMLRIE